MTKNSGWDVFESNSELLSSDTKTVIQRGDEQGIFGSDEEAILHVWYSALAGDLKCRQALHAVVSQWYTERAKGDISWSIG